jgi:hypothetical protein
MVASNVEMENGLECDHVKVMGTLSLNNAKFSSSENDDYLQTNTFRSTVIEGNLELGNADFREGCKLDFTSIKVGGSLDITETHWPTSSGSISLHGMSFRDIVPTRLDTFKQLLERSDFDPDAYNNIERFLRTSGHFQDANEIGKAQARREREENMSFFPGVWSWFLSIFVGNGYSPGRSLLWGLAIVLVGALVFRENRMACVREKPAGTGTLPNTRPPYLSFLYSLDLFVPAVNLGVATDWEPQPHRPILFYWMFAQKALGWILVPIGLLAFSGFIKA